MNLPLRLQKHGYYYGWIILIVGTFGVIASVPGQTMGISVYTDYLMQSHHLSRTELSLTYLLGTLSSSLLLSKAGQALDRFGARTMGVVACICLALSLIWIALSPQLSNIIASKTFFTKTKWISYVLIFLGFFGIRHFGQGQLTMISRTMMTMWFEKHRGMVMGVSGLFVAFGFGLSPLLIKRLIDQFQWQTSLYILAFLCFLMACIAFLFFRRSPEHEGLTIDGGNSHHTPIDKAKADAQLKAHSFTKQQAIASYTFWVFNIGLVGNALIFTGMTFNLSFIASINGLSRQQAFNIFLPIAIVSTVTDLIAGYLSDKIPLRFLLAVMQMGLLIALLGLYLFQSSIGYTLVFLGIGISSGIFAQLSAVAWPKFFGRAYLGSIAGFSTSWMVFGSSLGPYIFNLAGESLIGYHTMTVLLALLPLSVLIASFFAHQPMKKNA